MKYEKNTPYILKVTGLLTTGNGQYYLVEDNGMKFRVKMMNFQYNSPLPDTIKCITYDYDADGSPMFVQYKPDIARMLYTIGSSYPFTVNRKQLSGIPNRNRYYGYDKNGLHAIIQTTNDKPLPIGYIVRCTVKHINSEGILTVVPIDQASEQETNYLTFEQLQTNIRTAIPMETLSIEGMRALPEKEKKKVAQLLEEYDSQDGSWLLSYLSVLQAQIEMSIHHTDVLPSLIDYQQSIIEWLLEDSTFLSFYSPEIICNLRTRSERDLVRGNALKDAIQLIQSRSADDFLQKIFTKIQTSGYLLDREKKINTVIALFRIDLSLWEKSLYILPELGHYISININENNTDDSALQSLSELIRKFIDSKDLSDTQYTRQLLLLATYLLLWEDRENSSFAVYRSALYRYACLISPESVPILADKAFNTLTQNNKTHKLEFTWDDIIPQFKEDYLIYKLRISASNISLDDQPAIGQLITPGGKILLKDNAFSTYVGNTFNKLIDVQCPVEIMSLYDKRIRFIARKEFKPRSSESGNIQALKKCWNELSGTLQKQLHPSSTPIQTKTLPATGCKVTITIKAPNPRYPLLMFADINDPNYEGSGILSANEVCRFHINNMGNIFYEGDTFEATVVKVDENGKMAFSILQELFDMVTSTLSLGTRICAKLYKISKKIGIWITEKGYCIFAPLPAQVPEIGDTAILEISNINDNGYINANFIEPVEEKIDDENALASLISDYIDYCCPEENGKEEDKEEIPPIPFEEPIETDKQLSPNLVREFVKLMVTFTSASSSIIERYNLLGGAQLIASISGDEQLKEYVSLLMSYEESIYSFATHSGPSVWQPPMLIDDEAVRRYPTLASHKEYIHILKQYSRHMFDPQLTVGIATTKDKRKENIIRLVQAHCLLYHVMDEKALLPIHNELLKKINAGEFAIPLTIETSKAEEAEEAPNLGRENDTTEFKSSIVYVVNRSMPDMKQQSDIILRTIAGFLNAAGGTLYIGVADNGKIIGLQNDYAYMVCNSDGYERFIRQRILSTMGKSINSVIQIDFPTYGKLEICRITTPCYGKLIELNGTVWQRQGNSTIMLDGNSLAEQQQRKKIQLKNEIEALSDKKQKETPAMDNDALISQSLQSSGTIQTSVAAAFAISLQKKKEKKKAQPTQKKNTLATSVLRHNPLYDYEAEEGKETHVYLSLLDNGSYVLTDEMPHIDNSILTLAIGTHETGGTLLLCYDNAYVNRIPLKIFIQKKRDYPYKNGMNKDARLQFASIENGDRYVLVRTAKQGVEYLKLFPMEKIKINSDPVLKGTPLFSYDFGEVNLWEIIPEAESEKIEKLRCEKLQYQGFSINAETIASEIKYLKQLNILQES